MHSQYAKLLNEQFSSSGNVFGRPASLRDVSAKIGYSYEHVRQALRGKPVGSRAFSDALSAVAGLDAERMWGLARREKAVKRYGFDYARELAPPDDRRMAVLWPQLSPRHRTQLCELAEQLVRARRLRKR